MGSFLLELRMPGPLFGAAMLVESIPCKAFSAGARAQKAFTSECIELFSSLAQLFGLPRSVGQIYGLLFSVPRPLSFTDIVEQLDISKGSVSQGLRALREIGAILPDEVIEGRREHYVPETELRKLIARVLHGSIKPHLREGARRLKDFKAKHAETLATEGGERVVLLERLGKLQSWHRKGAAVLPLISKFIG